MQNHRNHDPVTSAMAGAHVERSGVARMHRAMCLLVVTNTPGLTAREIEDRIGIKAHKRLPELRRGGLIRNSKARACTVSGRQALTWEPFYTPHNGEMS